MIKLSLNESYIDDVSRVGEEKYDGSPIWRVVGLIEDGGRIQMYVLGIGSKDDDDLESNSNSDDSADTVTDSFLPAVRAARYTTEESLIFKSEHDANKYLTAFKKNYSDTTEFNLKEFHASEYNPFNEILKLIPIHTPIGDAFVCEQKINKKSYDKEDDKK